MGFSKQKLQKVFLQSIYPECNGDQLRKDIRDITVNGINIVALSKYSLLAIDQWIAQLSQTIEPEMLAVAAPIIDDLSKRVKRFIDVGVGYLSLDRSTPYVVGWGNTTAALGLHFGQWTDWRAVCFGRTYCRREM